MDHKKIAIILNAGSGTHEAGVTIKEIKEAFAAFHLEPKILLTHLGSDLKAKTRQAIADGFNIIVAAGGDGTVSAVAENLIHSHAVLGVLPSGTLNHFAKDMNIPLTIKDAVEVIINGTEKQTDIGQVNDEYFINNSSIGFYAKLVRHRERLQKSGVSKWLAFSYAFFTVLRLYPNLQVRLQSAEKDIHARTPIVFIGNNEYSLQGLKLGARQGLDSQQLSVHVAHHPSRLRLISMAFHALKGDLPSQDDFDVYQTRQVTIQSRKPYLNVSMDGEVKALATPLNYKILPGAIKVLVPKI